MEVNGDSVSCIQDIWKMLNWEIIYIFFSVFPTDILQITIG